MKAKIATALSLIGVLTAGSAAALVNTQILDGGPTESGASKAVLPPASSIALTVPTASDDTAIEVDLRVPDLTSTTTSTTTAPTILAASPTSEMLTSFDVGTSGVVTVDVVDGRLVLVSAEPKAGWTVSKAEDDSNDDSDEFENEVEVEFRSATIEVDFEAELVDGRIVPSVDSSFIGGSGGSAATSTTLFDEHDDDDDEFDDRDDDHDEDEYDEPDDDHSEDDRDDD